MTVRDFGNRVHAHLGAARPTNRTEAIEVARSHLKGLFGEIEVSFGRAGFYSADAWPYPVPTTPFDAPVRARQPKVEAVRGLWLGHWNPSDKRFRDGERSGSDIEDRRAFPWEHPEAALREGWWITTERWTDKTLHARVGDLVVAQRQRPKKAHQREDEWVDADDMYVGLAAVLAATSWLDERTGRYETRACLVPLCHFDHPVPINTAKRTMHRLGHNAFSKLPATADGAGMNRQLSAVPLDAAVELLSVCGVSPEILAEQDLATIAGRLAATETGNEEYLALRYDHQVRQAARHANEMRAEAEARTWAQANGYTFVSRDATKPLLGYDLLFKDDAEEELQIEVKGYSTDKLAAVNLQPSQLHRATEAAAGTPPDWRLYALLRASTNRPLEVIRLPQEVVDLVESGGIGVNKTMTS